MADAWSPRILVVDDDPLVRQALASVLQANLRRVEVATAEDGPSALRELAAGPFDVLVSDYSMPGMDGIELLRRARARQPNLVCLMLTASQELPVAKQAINELHVHGYLNKPVDAPTVVRQVADGLVVALRNRAQSALTQAQERALREALELLKSRT